ncbi:hypothetical protein E4T52_11670 [Aureobasidium sp. EXF-3400]|nr:hypothetical protein E4T52_11670 [Aureobasidium sp. EXF-3400]
MSKRVADGQGGAERYGGMEDPRDTAMDPPRKATAAQLAKRSIKPLKGRPGSSRSSSPSKTTPAPGFGNPFGGADSNPFGQSAPAPPAAASFNFGQTTSQAQSNPFGSMSTSQSFPPNAPANGSANPAASFSFGQSQPANAPAFAPPPSSGFSFGASTPTGTSFSFGATPAKPTPQNGDANKAPSFTFGSTPASPGPSAPASPAPAFNPFSSMSGPSFGTTEQPITAAEIHEIESAGPRLSQEGKLDALANIVRHSEPKYKDADLGGLDLSALPAAVQRKMLDFVRGKSETVSLTTITSFNLPRYTRSHGSADSHDVPLFASHMPQTYTHLPAFSEEHFMTDGSIDEAKLAQAAADANMPGAWQTGIAALQSRLDRDKHGTDQIHSYQYFSSSQQSQTGQQQLSFTPPAAQSFNPNAFAYARPYQPFNSVEGGHVPFVNHPHVEQDTQHDMLDVSHHHHDFNMQPQLPSAQPFANFTPYQTQPEASKPSFSFSSTTPAPAPAASTSFNFGASTPPASSSNQPETQSSPFKSFGATPAPASPAPSSGFKFGSTAAEPAKKDDTPTTSAFGGFGTSTAKKDDTPAKAPSAFNFGPPAASPAPAPSSSFNFGTSTATPASPAPAFNFGATAEKKDEAAPKPPATAFNFGSAATPAAPPSPKPAEKKLPTPSFAFGAPADPKPADEVAYPQLNFAPTQSAFTPAAAPESPKPQNAGLGNSMFNSAPAQQKPAESAFKGFGSSASAPAQASTTSPSFGFGSSVSAQAPAPPSRSESRTSTALSAPVTSSGVATPPASPQLPPSELESSLIKQVNESLRSYLASADTSRDWSAVVRFYLEQIADIRSGDSAAPSTAAIESSSAPKLITAPLAPSNTRGEKRPADEEVTKEDEHSKRAKQGSTVSTPSKPAFNMSTMSSGSPSGKPLSQTASLFDNILSSPDKPQTPQPANVFSASANKDPAPPATAPQAKSNPFGTIARNVSATPGPSAPKTSFVPPAGAQALPSSNNGTSAPSPFQIPKFGGSSTPSSAPASGFQLPKFGGGSSTAAPSFLGSFGQKAAEQEAKEREKRKEEDMDSDEDEEEWERKDAEKQAQKKAELLAASQALKFNVDTSKKPASSASAVFSFSGTPVSTANSSASSNIFGNLSGSKPDDEDNDGDTDEDEDVHAALTNASPAKASAGKSLFERVSFDAEKEKTADAPSASFKFSSFGSSGAADNTWKGSDPIKFGASTATAGTTTPDGSPAKTPAPKFNFGGASQTAEKSSPFSGMMGAKPAASGSIFDAAKPSAPTTGFSFGGAPSGLAPPSGSSVFASAATSRATTPGATTTDAEGSAAESEPSDTPNDAQKDLTSLTADDIANYNLVHEARCKVTKLVKGEDNKAGSWVSQGVGPIRILASKETSKPRILMRADPSGKVGLNFNALLNPALYMIKAPKMVQVSVPAEGKKVESFMCMFKDEAKAKEFLEKLHEAITKAQG